MTAIARAFYQARTLIWNGPLGAFEIAPFDAATNAAAQRAADLTREGRLISVAGGGDTVAALNKAGAADGFTYISTAGGAFLEWMEGKTPARRRRPGRLSTRRRPVSAGPACPGAGSGSRPAVSAAKIAAPRPCG